MRGLASGKNVTTFTVASNEFIGNGKQKTEYHPVVTWDRLADIAGTYLGKGQQAAIEGRPAEALLGVRSGTSSPLSSSSGPVIRPIATELEVNLHPTIADWHAAVGFPK